MNISALQNEHNGIFVIKSFGTNISTIRNRYNGIFVWFSEKTSMMNVSAVKNRKGGVDISTSTNTSINHTYTYRYGTIACTTIRTVYHTTGNIFVYKSRDTHILNSVVCGIEMTNAANIYITNTSSFLSAYNTKNIIVNDTIFNNMDAPSTVSNTSEPTSLPAVITLYGSTLTITDCTFTGNKMSSIKAFNSNLTLSGKVLFHNNIALSGTALLFAKNDHRFQQYSIPKQSCH